MKALRSFFVRKASDVARDLLGATIVRRIGNRERKAMIIEVEIYPGPHDRASHAYGRKRTTRNAAEYLIGGHVYIYLVYGMYWQLNISTGPSDYPACVLIRALFSHDTDIRRINGPGKLCRWLEIDNRLYGHDMVLSDSLWIDRRGRSYRKIAAGPRIGIDYAGVEWACKPLRLYLREYEKYLPRAQSKYSELRNC